MYHSLKKHACPKTRAWRQRKRRLIEQAVERSAMPTRPVETPAQVTETLGIGTEMGPRGPGQPESSRTCCSTCQSPTTKIGAPAALE